MNPSHATLRGQVAAHPFLHICKAFLVFCCCCCLFFVFKAFLVLTVLLSQLSQAATQFFFFLSAWSGTGMPKPHTAGARHISRSSDGLQHVRMCLHACLLSYNENKNKKSYLSKNSLPGM